MYTKKIYGAKDMVKWTRNELGLFFLISIIEVGLYVLSNKVFQIPFTPVAVIATALAFIIGFQSNAAYGRIWEARTIWGGIVNSSRAFGIKVNDFINFDHSKKEPSVEYINNEKKIIIYRHIAWLTALRYAMRAPKPWEYFKDAKTNREWLDMIYVPEFKIPFEEAIKPYLSEEDLAYISNKSNIPTALIYLQSSHLRRLKEQNLIWEFSFLELENVLEELLENQGKSERIKNFPYPRQFASLLFYITWAFIVVFPLGLVGQFDNYPKDFFANYPSLENLYIWVTVPFSVLIMWIFYTMNKIGRVGENPFEGTGNDVPISTISRAIEIDLRQNLGENPAEIPSQFEVLLDTQM